MISEDPTIPPEGVIMISEDPTILPECVIRLSEDLTSPPEGPMRLSEDPTSPLEDPIYNLAVRGPYHSSRGSYQDSTMNHPSRATWVLLGSQRILPSLQRVLLGS